MSTDPAPTPITEASTPPVDLSKVPAKPVLQFRVQTFHYANEEGHRIEERVCVKGVLPLNYPRFMGRCDVAWSDGVDQFKDKLFFPIQAPDLDTAFEKYPRLRDVAKARKLKEINEGLAGPEQPLIQVVGGQGNAGPGGLPLTGG
jgi:hypothetical protein